jgi:hypothetical protein
MFAWLDSFGWQTVGCYVDTIRHQGLVKFLQDGSAIEDSSG